MPKRYELPDLRPRDLVRLLNPDGQESMMYVDDAGGGHWVHFSDARRPDRLKYSGWNLRDHHGNYTELGRLRDVAPGKIAYAWPTLEGALRAAEPVRPAFSYKVGDTLTREQVAALPAGAVTQDLDLDPEGPYVEQWNGKGRGRVVGVSARRLSADLDGEWNEHPRPARLVALGTPLDDRRALYRVLADQGFAPAVRALADERKPDVPVAVSSAGTRVQVGDMVETTEEALTALPAGTVLHLWDPSGWREFARKTMSGAIRWWPHDTTARPWGVPGRLAVVIALGCADRESATRARDAFVAKPFKGREQAAALAAYLEGKISTEVKVALDDVPPTPNDKTISTLMGVVAQSIPTPDLQLPDLMIETPEMRQRREEWFNKVLAPRPQSGYREPMPETKSTMKLDLNTETLSVNVPRLAGESDHAYAARAAALVKPQANAVADNIMMQAQPSWLERAAEAFKPVAAELAAEAKVQTRQAIALGGVEVARRALHKGIAAAAQAVAPQHADKVVQVVDHPITRWLENAGLFLGARATGRPALAQVGLREVVRTPMEGAVGLLVQAASQIAGAVRGALVAADEAARVEQVTGQPEAARVEQVTGQPEAARVEQVTGQPEAAQVSAGG